MSSKSAFAKPAQSTDGSKSSLNISSSPTNSNLYCYCRHLFTKESTNPYCTTLFLAVIVSESGLPGTAIVNDDNSATILVSISSLYFLKLLIRLLMISAKVTNNWSPISSSSIVLN